MKISGLRQTSLIDYDGRIVTTLFTQGCNLRCAYCHNPELIDCWIDDKSVFDISDILDFLWRRRDLIDGVCITGGEPTLQQGLTDFAVQIKEMDLKIKLDTNGSLPEVMGRLIETDLVDHIAVDVKGIDDNPGFIGLAEGTGESYKEKVTESIDLIMEADIGYEFRTTVVPGIHTKADIEKIAERIQGADKYYLQNFQANNPLDSELEERRSFSDDELIEFKKIAKSYVDRVEIRG